VTFNRDEAIQRIANDVTAHPCPLCGNDRRDYPVVCGGCQARGERDLRDLPRLASTLLGIARTPSGATFAEPVSGSREKPLLLHTGIWSYVGLPSPGDVHAPDLEDALCQVGDVPLADALHTTCRAAADDLDVSVPKVRRNSPADEAAAKFVRFLLAQHDRICQLFWADEYLTEVHELWRRARTLAQDWPLVHKLPAPCPDCGTLTLRRDNGASFVYCDDRHDGCGRHWSEADYARLILILVTEAKELGWATTAKATT
jgi:predicted RNA-binding Zn-ribbon protein involved in translation (DUF1610 family)